MPRFFFDIHDGASLPDQEGTELPGLKEAYPQAITTAGQTLKEAGMDLLAGTPWRMEVNNEEGRLLLTLNFSAEVAPP